VAYEYDYSPRHSASLCAVAGLLKAGWWWLVRGWYKHVAVFSASACMCVISADEQQRQVVYPRIASCIQEMASCIQGMQSNRAAVKCICTCKPVCSNVTGVSRVTSFEVERLGLLPSLTSTIQAAGLCTPMLVYETDLP
jgi:hypothetical protein